MHQKADEVLAIREKNPGHYVNYFLEFKKRAFDQDLLGVTDYNFHILTLQHILEQKYLMRQEIIQHINVHKLHIFGKGNQNINKSNVVGHAYLDQNNELPKLYSSAKINLCTELHPVNVHQRIFEIAACAGFCISEYKEEIEQLFDYETEAVCFKSLEELEDLVSYYLKHDSERERYAQKAYERATQTHTVTHRMRELLAKLKQLFL